MCEHHPVSDLSAGGPHGRDLRIDFFRGLALYVILVDHIASNPLGGYTYHRFGFSDAAEVFVFLSGLSCGIVYHSTLMRRGVTGLAAATIKRAALIYAFYALSSIATILFVSANATAVQQSHMLDTSLVAFARNPFTEAWSAILLIKQPDFPSILVLYVALTLFVIPAVLLGARRNLALTIVASGCVWLVQQFYNLGSVWTNLFPYFNPLAWQFLFSIGMYFGIRYRPGAQKKQWPATAKWLLIGAWAIVTISLLYRFLPFLANKAHLDLGWLLPYNPSDDQHKRNLSVVRLMHFLSVAFLITVYVSPNNPALRWANDCVILTGRWSLQIFSAGAVLSVIGTIFFAIYSPSLLGKLAFNVGAILLTALTAIALSNYRVRSRSIDMAPDTGKSASSANIRL